MKKVFRKISFASLMLVATAMPALAVNEAGAADGMCQLLAQLQSVFRILRTLAFIGSAFIIAGWAWGYISSGKFEGIDKVKDKGIGLLVGFVLLFAIGAVLSFVTSAAGWQTMGCDITKGWN